MTRACLVVVLVLLAGCDLNNPEPVELQVGQHRVSVVIPEEWEHVDYGERHLLRKDFGRIIIEDLGWLGKDFDKSVRIALKKLKENEQRDEAFRKSSLLEGHQAVVVQTWDKLSHLWPKKFFFLKTEESLLTIYMMQGEFAAMEPAFDDLVTSFALADSLQQNGLDHGQGQTE